LTHGKKEPTPDPSKEGNWEKPTPNPSEEGNMVYDAARQRVVANGGTVNERACPTLEWDGS